MTDAEVVRARAALARLIDPAATRFDDEVEIASDDRADEVSLRLGILFDERPEVKALLIRLGGREVGVATLARLRAAKGKAHTPMSPAGPVAEVSMADRASLPGSSSQYRLVHFGCAYPDCQATEVRSFYDARTVPVCPTAGHGRMELRR